MPASQPQQPRTYDVCYSLPGASRFRKRDQGVTLGDDGIAWTKDGRTTEMPFGNIAAVHLSSSGASTVVERCTITFADDTALAVVNSDPGGFRDRQRASLYRDFVRDLHARLVAGASTAIAFTAGKPRWHYWMLIGVTIAGTLALVAGGLVAWLVFGNYRGVPILILGGYFGWRFGRTTLANAPRDYAPDRLPDELLS